MDRLKMDRVSGRRRRPLALLAGTCLIAGIAASLAGCHGANGPTPDATSSADALAALPAAVPMSTDAAPASVSAAPAAAQLAAAPAPRLGRLATPEAGYSYLDRAYAEENAVEDAPPDYGFDYGGADEWYWGAGDGGRVIYEPVDGGYRYYYYNAGSDEPYMVRDPRYSYAYDDGMLVGIYTLGGAAVSYGPGSPEAEYAGRYLYRGHALWSQAQQAPHRPVNAHSWGERHEDLNAERAQWHQQLQGNPDWSGWHAQHDNGEEAYWQQVHDQHEAAADRFSQWQQQDYQGPPPQFYNGQQGGGSHVGAEVVAGAVAAGAAAALLLHHDHGEARNGVAPNAGPAQGAPNGGAQGGHFAPGGAASGGHPAEPGMRGEPGARGPEAGHGPETAHGAPGTASEHAPSAGEIRHAAAPGATHEMGRQPEHFVSPVAAEHATPGAPAVSRGRPEGFRPKVERRPEISTRPAESVAEHPHGFGAAPAMVHGFTPRAAPQHMAEPRPEAPHPMFHAEVPHPEAHPEAHPAGGHEERHPPR